MREVQRGVDGLVLSRWSADGIGDGRALRDSSSANDVQGDSGLEVRTIRRIWQFCEEEFNYPPSFHQQGVVLIERVTGFGNGNTS